MRILEELNGIGTISMGEEHLTDVSYYLQEAEKHPGGLKRVVGSLAHMGGAKDLFERDGALTLHLDDGRTIGFFVETWQQPDGTYEIVCTGGAKPALD